MGTIPLKPERQVEVEKFAQEHGQTPADALDDAVAAQSQRFEKDVAAVQEALEGPLLFRAS